jgi:hypothetical protein
MSIEELFQNAAQVLLSILLGSVTKGATRVRAIQIGISICIDITLPRPIKFGGR